MSPSFLEIPDIPMEMIMNNLDYLAIQSVRKTCWDLRNFIDGKKPGIGMKGIEIVETYHDRDIMLRFKYPTLGLPKDTYIDITYEKHENGCRISRRTSDGYKNKIVENLNFLDAAFHDFRVALYTQKSIFEKVTVTGETFFEKFEETMKSQKPIATESMKIRGRCLLEHARLIMKHTDPKYLKSIVIHPQDLLRILETVKLESSNLIHNFSHFATAAIQLENFDVETLRAIKENFLQFHEYDKHLAVFDEFSIRRINLFIEAFGEPSKPLGEKWDIWFFDVPGNNERALKVDNRYLCFEFRFIDKCEVPESYVILN